MRREWIEIGFLGSLLYLHKSPSMRREWIEMEIILQAGRCSVVSLHAEGVD